MEASNFEFLKNHDPIFYNLASAAEKVFASDPNTSLIKLRQLGEALARDIASRSCIDFDENTTQADLLYRLNRELGFDSTVKGMFHTLRIEGNKAVHQFETRHKEAMDGLKIARELCIWFHRSFSKNVTHFKPGPFIPPKDPSIKLQKLNQSIEQLKTELREKNQEVESSKELTELILIEKKEYEDLALKMEEESKLFEELARDSEEAYAKKLKDYEKKIKSLQNELKEVKDQAFSDTSSKINKANKKITLTEEVTRILIDQQLTEAGWKADTQKITYKKGYRPEKGKNIAIAEWPVQERQRADYVLFSGLTPIAVVEAKRQNENVSGKIAQAERYSLNFRPKENMTPAWEKQGLTIAWPYGEDKHYYIPFVYSCNGRPYVKQLAEQSGIWFRDVREPSNIKKALEKFHSPAGLEDRLKRSREEAEKALKNEGFEYLKLRDYQIKAVQAVESAIENNRKECLVAMATGTGKTRTITGLMYRFLKSERFKRILFLVDRRSLGEQASDVFHEVPLEKNQPLGKIYNIAKLGDMKAQAETRLQVATVQSMVKRIFQSDDPAGIDEFDCIIVDEAHRGYTLDQEMTETEIEIRDQSQYLSSYRRVLDYFDAVKIGLTATPAKHTTEIFGKPVYTYSYREAVAADWLIDHEPPVRYITNLSKNGINFEKGEKVKILNSKNGDLESAELEDELNFEIEAFNKKVITENFNRVICEELAKEIDPSGDEKTLIFCASDLHADMVKRLLDESFKSVYEDEYNEASVRKITGKSDKPDQLIREFKNEKYPSIGITVDLLTTGIDVPKICHLVFLRRVKSRILYEQMIGRATRRCDEIGKTIFKIYDPVDIYSVLDEVSTMKPLVKNPNITMEQLIDELNDPETYTSPGSLKNTTHADDVLNALNQKLMRIMRKASHKSEKDKNIKEKLEELQSLWGVEPSKLHNHLKTSGPEKAKEFLNKNKNFLSKIDEIKNILGTENFPVISEHKDALCIREQSYGDYKKPEDYLESFESYIKENINESAALTAVINRPKDLTRQDLKDIKILLDQNGFTEAKLKTAWRNTTNQDIAASIIGHIRKAALGEALISFEKRVDSAMEIIYSLHTWSTVQRKWLERIAKQLKSEVIIDSSFINRAFRTQGGAKIINKTLGEKLEIVLDTLSENLWNQAG